MVGFVWIVDIVIVYYVDVEVGVVEGWCLFGVKVVFGVGVVVEIDVFVVDVDIEIMVFC